MKKNALIAVYSHPEGYPPTLNAIELLSQSFDEIVVVHRNVMMSEWTYPTNVRLVTFGKFTHYSTVSTKGIAWKLWNFISFVWTIVREMRSARPVWVILYEPIAVLAWWFVRPLANREVKVWYHNHDVILGNENFLSRWAFKAQSRLFSSFDKFSLPSNERKQYFPMAQLRGQYHFLPNFPGLYFYDRFFKPRTIGSEVRLVYQGYISAGHGFEEILAVLKTGIEPGISLKLVLKGYRDEAFLQNLLEKAKELGVFEQMEIHEVTSYQQVPLVASGCHIGIGIQTKTDVMTKTLGTASNKIYEYAGVGLPVLLFDNEQFRSHLQCFSWAFFTDCTPGDLRGKIKLILDDYSRYSYEARKDFKENLNFEKFFSVAIKDI
jgi:hypothetical protein